jgi:hypothetical protein
MEVKRPLMTGRLTIISFELIRFAGDVAALAKIKDQRERWETVAPLDDARVTRLDVDPVWSRQSFRLGLPTIDGKTPAGNCDLCFLKSAKTISAILRSDPGLADWWIRMEEEARPDTPQAGVFRKDRPNYRRMRDAVLAQQSMDFGEQDALAECFCHE